MPFGLARPALISLLSIAAVAACNDTATFVRAKDVTEYPPEPRTASQAQSVSPSCIFLGQITESTSLLDVGRTVAKYGGTHFIVTDERSYRETVTPPAQGIGGSNYGSPSMTEMKKLVKAEAYRCKSERLDTQLPPLDMPPPPPPPPASSGTGGASAPSSLDEMLTPRSRIDAGAPAP